jgi:15-cis-phytoene synthase
MSSDPTVRAAYGECRRLARQHYENFPVASYLVPRAQRNALAAIYAFARQADDVADEPGREGRAEALAAWRRKLGECYAGQAQGAVWIALRDSVQRFQLSRGHFDHLITAFESDVGKNRHADFQSLLDYCRNSANPVGRLVLELFGHREPELHELSDRICTALQLTNFWQDVRGDFARGRVYLPLEDLRRCEYTLEDLRAQCADERWKRLMSLQVSRARELFEQGKSLLENVRPELRRQLRLTWLGGMAILARIEAAGYDVFRRRPSLSRSDFVRLYFKARSPLEPALAPAANGAAARRVRRLTTARATNFYYAFVFLPREKRRAIEAVYAFARRGDDLADGNLNRQQRAREFERYRADLESCYAAGSSGGAAVLSADPALAALARAVGRFQIPRRYFDDLIQGFEMDAQMDSGQARFETFDDLRRYCYHVAGAIGLMSIEIFGYRNPRTREYARSLGTALQLVNILRDLESDARRRRIYLPREDLDRFGVTPEAIFAKRYDDSLVRLMEFEAARARDYFERAQRELAPEDRRAMRAAETMAAIYARLLERIRARRYNVFGERVRLSRPLKFWIALRTYLGFRRKSKL